jgi:hypothetical protein
VLGQQPIGRKRLRGTTATERHGTPGEGAEQRDQIWGAISSKDAATCHTSHFPHLPPKCEEGEIATPSHRPHGLSGERGRLARSARRFMAAFGFAAIVGIRAPSHLRDSKTAASFRGR